MEKIWKLNIPAEIKIFGWRALHGFIPCLGVLANIHIATTLFAIWDVKILCILFSHVQELSWSG
jgi:hypothetical protein